MKNIAYLAAAISLAAFPGLADTVTIGTVQVYDAGSYTIDPAALQGFEMALGDELCQRAGFPSLRRLRISAANIGPNRCHQKRTVWRLISVPRSRRWPPHISKRKWKPDAGYHRQADDLGIGSEVSKWTAFGGARTL